MTDDFSQHDLIDELADEFVSRQQAGEQPLVSEYCQRHPELEEEIRELFPMLAMLESAKSPSGDVAGAEQIEKIGDYRILREIGRGGMGVVYEAQHRSLGRRVALKLLPPRLSVDNRALARFHREARAIAKLHHTNIVPLFEVGNDGGRFFFAMQLISGRSLDQAIVDAKSHASRAEYQHEAQASESGDAGPSDAIGENLSTIHTRFPELDILANQSHSSSSSTSGQSRAFRWIAGLGVQAAEALAYAHERGIIHRDVKPSNILLDESGIAWLSDFGLAKMGDDELTQTGDFVGTLRYMAPERFRGECDERADIYGLGLTLYELLSMEHAFQSSDRPQLIDMICQVDPPRLRDRNPRVPRDLETIVMKACEKDPKFRYATAQDLANDLRHFVADEPIQARRTSLWEQAVRWSRRNRGLAAAISVSALLLVVLTTVSVLFSIRQNELRQQSEQRGTEIQEKSDELQRSLYRSQMTLAAQAAFEKGGIGTGQELLAEWEPERVGADVRGWEWFYLYSLLEQASFRSEPQRHWTWEVDLSPDGRRIVNVVNGWGIQIRDATSGEVVLDKYLGSARSVDWSPDGTRIASSDFRGDIHVWDAETLDPILSIENENALEVRCATWSPDSTKIASCREPTNKDDSVVEIWDANTGDRIRTLRGHTNTVRTARWSPDGERLASISRDDTVRIWDVSSGEQIAKFDGVGASYYSLCWSPDGSKVAIGGDIRVWDVNSQKEISRGNLDQFVVTVSWRPGTNQLACGGENGLIRLWDVETKKLVRDLLGHTEHVRSICWTADGKKMVSSGLDHIVQIWDLDVTAPYQRFDDCWTSNIDWSPDGTFVAASSRHEFVNGIYPSTQTQNIKRLSEFGLEIPPDDHRLVIDVAVSPDSRRVAFTGVKGAYLWNVADDTIEQLDEKNGVLDWSSNGLLAITVKADVLSIWDRDGKRVIGPLQLPVEPGVDIWSQKWNSDGTRLAFVHTNNQVSVWDPQTQQTIWQARSDWTTTANDVAWSNDGTRLATCHDGAVVLWDAATGENISVFSRIKDDFYTLDWSPDDTRLAVGGKYSVNIWDVESQKLAFKIAKPASSLQWSPNGRRLAIGGGNSGGGVLEILDATIGYERLD